MKRWNWPTTILYIKHKKANLKQGCSKLVGKKRKAPTGGWSGGLNCPIGGGEITGMSLSPERAELPDLGNTPGRARPRGPGSPAAATPGPEAFAQPAPPARKGDPTAAELDRFIRGYPER